MIKVMNATIIQEARLFHQQNKTNLSIIIDKLYHLGINKIEYKVCYIENYGSYIEYCRIFLPEKISNQLLIALMELKFKKIEELDDTIVGYWK